MGVDSNLPALLYRIRTSAIVLADLLAEAFGIEFGVSFLGIHSTEHLSWHSLKENVNLQLVGTPSEIPPLQALVRSSGRYKCLFLYTRDEMNSIPCSYLAQWSSFCLLMYPFEKWCHTHDEELVKTLPAPPDVLHEDLLLSLLSFLISHALPQAKMRSRILFVEKS